MCGLSTGPCRSAGAMGSRSDALSLRSLVHWKHTKANTEAGPRTCCLALLGPAARGLVGELSSGGHLYADAHQTYVRLGPAARLRLGLGQSIRDVSPLSSSLFCCGGERRATHSSVMFLVAVFPLGGVAFVWHHSSSAARGGVALSHVCVRRVSWTAEHKGERESTQGVTPVTHA